MTTLDVDTLVLYGPNGREEGHSLSPGAAAEGGR